MYKSMFIFSRNKPHHNFNPNTRRPL